MSKHLFGLIVTPHGTAANNRGENEGNITTLQKILWNGEVHSSVSAEAIRFAIRWYWQRRNGEQALNRRWNDEHSRHDWSDSEFTQWQNFMDDDILGFMSAKAGNAEGNEAEQGQGRRGRVRGTCDKRRARLEVTRAISLSPFAGDLTFNAASPGATPSASSTGRDPVPYGTELHATRYQYGFALTPEYLHAKSRALDVIDAVTNLSDVAGNHARFLFDFSPDSIVFRWTDDFAPRILYGFSTIDNGDLKLPELIRRVEAGDIDAKELVVGGSITTSEQGKVLGTKGAFVTPGVKTAANEIKRRLREDLALLREG